MLRSSFTALRYRPDAVLRRVASRPRGGLLSGTGAPYAWSGNSDPGVNAGSEPRAADGGSMESRLVMNADQIGRACARMAHQILEANQGANDLVLMGIPTRGVPLAHRLAKVMDELESVRVPVGALDVTMYRDDLRRQPTRAVGHTDLPVEVEGSTVVLVDDVLYSGRTVRAALDALGDLGRPRAVRLAVLVDRGHRELPIHADHVGSYVPTRTGEHVTVRLAEIDGINQVTIEPGIGPDRREA
jgi:pyrimidine operon attenuation protein / uracil phosphoribosyltransferase